MSRRIHSYIFLHKRVAPDVFSLVKTWNKRKKFLSKSNYLQLNYMKLTIGMEGEEEIAVEIEEHKDYKTLREAFIALINKEVLKKLDLIINEVLTIKVLMNNSKRVTPEFLISLRSDLRVQTSREQMTFKDLKRISSLNESRLYEEALKRSHELDKVSITPQELHVLYEKIRIINKKLLLIIEEDRGNILSTYDISSIIERMKEMTYEEMCQFTFKVIQEF